MLLLLLMELLQLLLLLHVEWDLRRLLLLGPPKRRASVLGLDSVQLLEPSLEARHLGFKPNQV